MKRKIIIGGAVVAAGGLGYLAWLLWKRKKAANQKNGPSAPGYPGPPPVIPASVPSKPAPAARPTGAKPTVPTGRFPLKMGSRGTEVELLQRFLNQQYNAGLRVDGIWGNDTERALKAAGQPTVISEQAWTVAQFAMKVTNLSGFPTTNRII